MNTAPLSPPMPQEAKAMEAGAAAEATVDGREFATLGRVDKERYVNRFADGLSAYLAALRTAEPVEAAALSEEPDEVTEDEIRSRAKDIIRRNGWLEQKAPPQLHSIIELMVSLGLDVLKNRPASCGYPGCGCDFDAVCNAALASPAVAPATKGGVPADIADLVARHPHYDDSAGVSTRMGDLRAVVAALAQDTDGVAKREVAWLIERKFPPTALWYAENVTGFHWWASDANLAKRFASKADAEAFPAYQMIASDPAISVTEHVFWGANP